MCSIVFLIFSASLKAGITIKRSLLMSILYPLSQLIVNLHPICCSCHILSDFHWEPSRDHIESLPRQAYVHFLRELHSHSFSVGWQREKPFLQRMQQPETCCIHPTEQGYFSFFFQLNIDVLIPIGSTVCNRKSNLERPRFLILL